MRPRKVTATFATERCVNHAEGIFECERIFGITIENSDGKQVPVRYIGEQHVMEDLWRQDPHTRRLALADQTIAVDGACDQAWPQFTEGGTMINVALETRLTKLPPKVSLPFVKLLHTGHIKPEHLDDILIAGHLAGNASTCLLSPSPISRSGLQAVPVTDVIRMALQQSRKINLAWSVKRWRAEHDRLSRAETLKRLAADNTFYDLEGFALHLPDKFPGYLIKSSRRLGMEGLRQRHCVRSYHSRILMKHCAIVAVFINGVRWTVELFLQQSDPDNPLRIGQIKTRRNGNPDSATRRAIHAALDIDLPARVRQNAVDDDDEPIYLENLRRVLPVLRRLGIDEVAVHFEGGGDSGCIDYIDFDDQPQAT